MIIALCAFQISLTPNRVAAMLDFANMATPGVIRHKPIKTMLNVYNMYLNQSCLI